MTLAMLIEAVAVGAGMGGSSAQAAVAPVLNIPVIPWREMDARSFAMGGAYVAVAQGVTATYWNPAGLASSPWLQVEAGVQPQLTGTNWQTLKGILDELRRDQPDLSQLPEQLDVQAAAAGGGGVALRTAGAAVWGWGNGAIKADKQAQTLSADSQYWLDAVAGGGMTVPLALPGLGRVSVGAVVKHVTAGMGWMRQDPPHPGAEPGTVVVSRTTVQAQGSGNAVDLGARIALSPRWVIAGAVKNVGLTLEGTSTTRLDTVTSVGGQLQTPVVSEQLQPFAQVVTPSWRVGLATEPGLPGLLLAADVDSQRMVHLGGEWALPGRLVSLRAGTILSDQTRPEYRVGAGAKLGILAADVAATWQQGQLGQVFVQTRLEF